MPGFFNGNEVRTIYDADRKRRVVVFQRTDGFYGFDEEHFDDDPLAQCWISASTPGSSNSLCDSLETVLREVYGRVSWLSSKPQR